MTDEPKKGLFSFRNKKKSEDGKPKQSFFDRFKRKKDKPQDQVTDTTEQQDEQVDPVLHTALPLVEPDPIAEPVQETAAPKEPEVQTPESGPKPVQTETEPKTPSTQPLHTQDGVHLHEKMPLVEPDPIAAPVQDEEPLEEKKESRLKNFFKREKDPETEETTPTRAETVNLPAQPLQTQEGVHVHERTPLVEPDPIGAPIQDGDSAEEKKESRFKNFFKRDKGEQGADGESEGEAQPKVGFFQKLKNGLQKSRGALGSKLTTLFAAGKKIDEDLLEELEEMLIGSDLGVQTSMEIIEKIRIEVDRKSLKDGAELKQKIKSEMLAILGQLPDRKLDLDQGPTIILIVGVNGVGKTTTIGKLARNFQNQGKSVMVCAADTFRAAAMEQLQVWADRAQVDIVMKEGSTDPAAVVFDALEQLKAKNNDVLMVDTAGRLHNNPNLMKELEKIRRIITRNFPNAPHHTLLILDAVTGQNGLAQAKQFVEKVGVTDLVITKLDGTAKGGIAVAIAHELDLPIQYLGVGEGMDDLLPFDRESFVNALFEDESLRVGES